MVYCLSCGAEIELLGEAEGEIVVCYECGQDWVVAGEAPHFGIRFPSPEDEKRFEREEKEEEEDEWEI